MEVKIYYEDIKKKAGVQSIAEHLLRIKVNEVLKEHVGECHFLESHKKHIVIGLPRGAVTTEEYNGTTFYKATNEKYCLTKKEGDTTLTLVFQ